MSPKLEDQLKSEEKQAGQELDRRQQIKALLVLLLIFLVVTLGVVLCQAASKLSPITMQILM